MTKIYNEKIPLHMKISPSFFFNIFNDKLICGIIGSKKIALLTQCYQYALQLLSKGAIPTYACIYQSMLSLFGLKSLLTISIITELLFVYIFCHYNRKNTFE